MNQRVMIAMAIACNPQLLIADEPTTALDVTIQAQILDLLLSLQRERGMALVLITHDMGVVAETAQRVMVMYAGQIMEERRADALFADAAASLHRGAAGRAAGARERRARLATIPGVVPGLHDRPRGCLFSPRCAYATEHSRSVQPAAARTGADGRVRCHYPLGDPQPRRRARRATRPAGDGGARDERARHRRARADADLSGRQRPVRARRRSCRRSSGVSFTLEAGPDAGRRRRIRLRQVDAGAHGDADRDADRGRR